MGAEGRVDEVDVNAEIQQFMAGLQGAWSRQDLAEYLSYWSADADVVNRAGQRFRGLAQAAAQWRRLFERGLTEIFTAETEVIGVRRIAPGVVVVHQARREPARDSLAVYVLVRQGEQGKQEERGESGERAESGNAGVWLAESLTIAPVE